MKVTLSNACFFAASIALVPEGIVATLVCTSFLASANALSNCCVSCSFDCLALFLNF